MPMLLGIGLAIVASGFPAVSFEEVVCRLISFFFFGFFDCIFGGLVSSPPFDYMVNEEPPL